MLLTYNDEVLEILDKIYATIIYRDEFDEEVAYLGFKELQAVIDIEELPGEYFIINHMLARLREIKSFRSQFKFKLTTELFDSNIDLDIANFIQKYEDNLKDLIIKLGLSTELSISMNFELACSAIASYCKQKFRDLVELEVKSEECLNYIEQLRVVLQKIFCNMSIITSSEIMINGTYVGKKFYKGMDGYMKFVKEIPVMFERRFKRLFSSKESFLAMDSVQTFREFMIANKDAIKPLFKLGIKPLDELLHISTSDVVTIIGDEGVGKTNYLVNIALQAITAGQSVVFMTGESKFIKINSMILSRYIFLKYKLRISWKEISNILDLPEKIQKIINDCSKDLSEDENLGRLYLVKEFTYEGFKKEAREILEKYTNISTLCIDHLDRLKSSGTLTENGFLRNQKEKVDYLIQSEVDLSDEFPICVFNLSHTSAEAAKLLAKGKDTGVRSGSSTGGSTKEADFVFMLVKAYGINNDSFLKFVVKKVRDFSDKIKPFLLLKDLTCCNFIYDEQYQYKSDDVDDEDDIESELD